MMKFDLTSNRHKIVDPLCHCPLKQKKKFKLTFLFRRLAKSAHCTTNISNINLFKFNWNISIQFTKQLLIQLLHLLHHTVDKINNFVSSLLFHFLYFFFFPYRHGTEVILYRIYTSDWTNNKIINMKVNKFKQLHQIHFFHFSGRQK